MFFLYAGNIEKYPFFPTFLEQKIWEYKTIISHLMFSSCFFLYAGGGGWNFVLVEKQFFLISRFMLFSTLKNIEKCPFTYWLNGRWLLQIVERDSWNLYPLYPLFPCSDFVSQMWGWFGGVGV